MPHPVPPAVPVGVPSPTLAVVGAGFGRTGTLSLRDALERLGFAPCDHMSHTLDRPERFARWLDALARKRAGQPVDWRPLFAGYRATVDWPGAYFWRELVAAHPQAKVVLTVRDPERWYDSTAATIWTIERARVGPPLARLAVWLVGKARPDIGRGLRVVSGTVWDGALQGRFADREATLAIFRDHVAAVRSTVPADRLLVFEVSEGWGPLCAFLGVPVPDEPFPHVNDTADFNRRLRAELLSIARRGVAVASAAGAVVALGLTLRRR